MKDGASYYNRPIVKPHVWTSLIPWYFWVGGTTGAAAAHGAIERMRGNDAMADVQKRAALAGLIISPMLLVFDLGVPGRFLNMLRVLKVTSPMSVGSWILVSLGGVVFASNAADWIGARRVGRALEIPAAILGPCLTAYTAALIANTATPVWHEAYEELPFVFAAGGIAGAGACGAAFCTPDRARSARRMMTVGTIGGLIAMKRMESRLGALISEPYREGRAGALKRASTALGVAGALIGLAGRANGTATRIAAALVAASGVCERFAIMTAGKQSAADPSYVVASQRASGTA